MTKAWMYLKKAGTFILAASMLIWFASNYPKYPSLEQEYATKIEQSHDEARECSCKMSSQAHFWKKAIWE